MKKIVFILGLFLIFSGFSNAQVTKTISFKQVTYVTLYPSCGNVEMGMVAGEVELHFVMHYVKGIPYPVWMNIMGGKSNLVGYGKEIDGEHFTISELDKINNLNGTWQIVHSNMKGDKGHHFILKGYIDNVKNELVWEKAVCPGDE
jgi:hypothetical protein